MKKIMKFLDRFFHEESKMLTYRRILNLDRYNSQVRTVQEFLSPEVHESMSDVEMRFEGPDSLYTMTDEDPLRAPRTLFKLSKYTHPTYKTVWVAYTNMAQSSPEIQYLSCAIFIIEQDGKLEIANIASYDSFWSDGKIYKWENIAGKEDLNFSTIDGPNEILRIKEPFEGIDSLKLFYEDK